MRRRSAVVRKVKRTDSTRRYKSKISNSFAKKRNPIFSPNNSTSLNGRRSSSKKSRFRRKRQKRILLIQKTRNHPSRIQFRLKNAKKRPKVRERSFTDSEAQNEGHQAHQPRAREVGLLHAKVRLQSPVRVHGSIPGKIWVSR